MRPRHPSVEAAPLLAVINWAACGSRPLVRVSAQRGPAQEGGVPGRAANARIPDTMIRPPATTKTRLTELSVTPATVARKGARTVLVSQPQTTTEDIDASWLTGMNTAITRPMYSRGAAARSSGATAVF